MRRIYVRREKPEENLRCLGDAELRAWVDHHARAILGLSGPEFIERYQRGDLFGEPMAHSIASVLPLLRSYPPATIPATRAR